MAAFASLALCIGGGLLVGLGVWLGVSGFSGAAGQGAVEGLGCGHVQVHHSVELEVSRVLHVIRQRVL